ncbi:glycosyltransferase family 4 protein [Staphylococcus caprae]|uniref:glycosyltransferase family 4 protein n=1 Tax=Staphylococcus caprae TaxID=29380 RepID=UPI0005C9998B|nr:glycosyltransferase [Staphylococcus caprae]
MFYFVGNNIGQKITGIEKAIINRLNLFKEYHYSARIVLLAWNRYLTDTDSNYITNEDYINMYDYFQESTNVMSIFSKNWLHYWEEECGYTVRDVHQANDVRVYDGENFIMYAHFSDDTLRKIDYINYFDTSRRKIKRELYDTRGFLSCTRILSTDQKIQSEFYYSPSGEVKIEKYFDIDSNEPNVAKKILLNYCERVLFFNNDKELGAFFIEKLYQNGDVFFSDRNLITSHVFNSVSNTIPVVAVLHSTHVKDISDLEHSRIKNVYKGVFDHLERYRAIVVSTQQQKEDVSHRIRDVIPVYAIPVGFSEEATESNFGYQNQKLISVARYSPEKQLEQQVRLVNKLKEEFPHIELHLYGFGAEERKLKDLIQEYHLNNHVFLRGFINDLTDEFKTAYVSLVTSNMEGFSLALLESQSHGVPTISYDIKYGPSELIINDYNGLLVNFNDENQLYEKVRNLLLNPELQKMYSKNSIETSQNYSKNAIIKRWEQLLSLFN